MWRAVAIAFDPVPFVIGGGAEHSDEVFRMLANAATRDAQGILLPGDMKVTALGTPGPQVQIGPGGVVIRNAQAAGQSYVGRGATATTVNIGSTAGAGARSDLVIARVIDPDFSPWQAYTTPSEIKFGPYFAPHVIPGVAANTTKAEQVVSYSAYALARIDQPANNSSGNITGAMVVDLRELAQPRTWPEYDVQLGPTPSQDLGNTVGETTQHNWPSTAALSVPVPRWATHAQAAITLNQIAVGDGAKDARTRILFGSLTGPEVNFDYNGNPSASTINLYERISHTTYAEFDVRAYQGTTQVMRPQARHAAGPGLMRADRFTQIIFDVRFRERTV